MTEEKIRKRIMKKDVEIIKNDKNKKYSYKIISEGKVVLTKAKSIRKLKKIIERHINRLNTFNEYKGIKFKIKPIWFSNKFGITIKEKDFKFFNWTRGRKNAIKLARQAIDKKLNCTKKSCN